MQECKNIIKLLSIIITLLIFVIGLFVVINYLKGPDSSNVAVDYIANGLEVEVIKDGSYPYFIYSLKLKSTYDKPVYINRIETKDDFLYLTDSDIEIKTNYNYKESYIDVKNYVLESGKEIKINSFRTGGLSGDVEMNIVFGVDNIISSKKIELEIQGAESGYYFGSGHQVPFSVIAGDSSGEVIEKNTFLIEDLITNIPYKVIIEDDVKFNEDEYKNLESWLEHKRTIWDSDFIADGPGYYSPSPYIIEGYLKDGFLRATKITQYSQ